MYIAPDPASRSQAHYMTSILGHKLHLIKNRFKQTSLKTFFKRMSNFARLDVCWSFISWQHLRSYYDDYQLMTVRIHGGLIALPHWKTKSLAL